MLSEEAKLGNLTEKILDVANNERNGLLIISMSAFLVSAGLIISFTVGNIAAFIGGSLVTVFGVFSIMFGFYVTIHYAHQYNNLLEEVDTIAERK